jgi:hypothetical protein
MPAGNFDDTLELIDGTDPAKATVNAHGPWDMTLDLKEICVWVSQRHNEHDAFANAMAETSGMTMPMPNLPFVDPATKKWTFSLPVTGNKEPLVAGPAFGVAAVVAVDSNGKQRVLVWGEPVELIVAS